MKKIISCGLLLAMLGSVGTMCFAMSDYEMYSVCNKVALELKRATDLRDEYLDAAVAFWNDTSDPRSVGDTHLLSRSRYNTFCDKLLIFNDTVNLMSLREDHLKELEKMGVPCLTAERDAVTDLCANSFCKDRVLGWCKCIDFNRVKPSVSDRCGGSEHFQTVANNYEDICAGWPKSVSFADDIWKLNYDEAALALILMDNSFDRIDKSRVKWANEAQNLSDKLYADECIDFANAWGGDYDDSAF